MSRRIAERQPELSARPAIAGMNSSCPVDLAAPKAPMTRKRKSCQTDRTWVNAARPAAIATQPNRMTLRGPNRFTRVPEIGPLSPNVRMLTAIAAEMVARSQPNSLSSGVIRTPGAARTLDATRRARKVTRPTTHA